MEGRSVSAVQWIFSKFFLRGDPEEIAREAEHMINALGKFNGGFIGKAYPQPDDIDLPKDGIEVMYKVFKQYNPYKQVRV